MSEMTTYPQQEVAYTEAWNDSATTQLEAVSDAYGYNTLPYDAPTSKKWLIVGLIACIVGSVIYTNSF